jgi:hypothetical protein
LAVIVVGAIVAVVFVHSTHADSTLLGKLTVSEPHTSLLGKRPTQSQASDPSTSGLKEVKKAAAEDPTNTGQYLREWAAPKSAQDAAALLVSFLPSEEQAVRANRTATSLYGSTTALGTSYTRASQFTVPDVPGSSGTTFAAVTPTSGQANTVYTITFQFGRAAVVEFVDVAQTALSQSDAESLAKAQYSLLRQTEPGFSIARSTWPWLASLLCGVITVVVAAAVFVVPEWVGRTRDRRVAQAEFRSKSQYRSRGSRAVRRHRAPAWRQPRRRR